MTELRGASAAEYVDEHLVLVEYAVRPGGSERVYSCPVTPWVWLSELPKDPRHLNDAPERLRRFEPVDLPSPRPLDTPLSDAEARRLLAQELASDGDGPGPTTDSLRGGAFENVQSSSAFMRVAGARVLGQLGPPGAAAALGRLLDDEDDQVVLAARAALQALPPAVRNPDARLGVAWRGRVDDPIGDPVLAPWIAASGLEAGLADYVDKRVSETAAVALTSLFWPAFVEVDGCVVLSSGADAANVASWLETFNGDRQAVEKMVNHRHLEDAFSWTVDASANGRRYLGEVLGKTWVAAASEAFPGRRFRADVFDENGDGDTTVTIARA